jgi:hypothetical protein
MIAINGNYMLRRPKRSKNEVVAPKEEEEADEIMWKNVVETDRPQMAIHYRAANMLIIFSTCHLCHNKTHSSETPECHVIHT